MVQENMSKGTIKTLNDYEANGNIPRMTINKYPLSFKKSKDESPDSTFFKFSNKLQTFAFAPPSDNLWLVEITLADRKSATPLQSQSLDNKNLLQLYKNIITVNEKWDSLNGESWKITHSELLTKTDDFIKALCESDLKFFLAQTANFTPLSINYDNQPFAELQQHGSFFKNGKTVKSRKDDDQLKIGFLSSNWDIGDILIEPWMAAIAQYGLIETNQICIKAKIIITEYSSSRPKLNQENDYGNEMVARKQYIFNNCFPVSRDEIKKSYDPNDAGTYKTQVVSFIYDTYHLNYLF